MFISLPHQRPALITACHDAVLVLLQKSSHLHPENTASAQAWASLQPLWTTVTFTGTSLFRLPITVSLFSLSQVSMSLDILDQPMSTLQLAMIL